MPFVVVMLIVAAGVWIIGGLFAPLNPMVVMFGMAALAAALAGHLVDHNAP